MANTLKFKRGLVSTIPTAALGEPLFTTDTFDLYIGNGTTNTRFQKYIASGTTSQLLRGDGSLLTMPIVLTSPSNGQVLKYDGTNWVNSSDAGVTGSGANGQVTYWGSSSTITGSNNLFWDATNNRLGIGTNSPRTALHTLLNGNVSTPLTGTTIVGQNSSSGSNSYLSLIGSFSAEAGIIFTDESVAHRGRIIYNNNTEFMSFWTDLAERMRLFATGNLAIGSTTDNGLRFQVTGDGYFSGSVGIGTTSLTNRALAISRTMTGSTDGYGILQVNTVSSGVTASAINNYSQFATQAATFTLSNAYHYYHADISIGAGSTITNQYGYFAANIVAATNNYGFYGNIAAATGRWNLYMNGTANNYMAGSLGIGSTSLTDINLRISKLLSGSVYPAGVYLDSAVSSTSTTGAAYFLSIASTQASSFTVPVLDHYFARQGTFGAGSTVTNQYGFRVHTSLVGATNNYGFYGDIASGTGRWNLYMNGTAQNFVQGSLGIGVAIPTTKLDVFDTVTTQLRVRMSGQADMRILSDTGYGALSLESNMPLVFRTNATERMRLDASGNLGLGVVPGAWISSARVAQIGNGSFYNNTSNLTAITHNVVYGASTNNYIASSQASAYWQINGRHEWYQAPSGTAGNAITFTQAMTLFATGNLAVGTTTDAGFKLDVNGTMRVSGASTFGGATNFITNTNHVSSEGRTRFYFGSNSETWLYADGYRFRSNAGTDLVTISSTGASTFGGNMALTLSQNASTRITTTNDNVGVNTKSEFVAVSRNSGTTYFGRYSVLTTAYKIINASDGYVLNETLGDFAILNDVATGSIKMAAGGSSTAHFTIASTGQATFSGGASFGSGFRGGLSSPNAGQIFYQADNTGWQLSIGKLVSTTYTAQMVFKDNATVTTTSDFIIAGGYGLDFINGSGNTVTAMRSTAGGASIMSSTSTGTHIAVGTEASSDLILASNNTERIRLSSSGFFSQLNATNPSSSITDSYIQYSADVVAGNAAPHFRTENGAVVKLYQETTSVGNAIFSQGGGNSVLDDSTFDGYTLRQIVKALRNQGILQ